MTNQHNNPLQGKTLETMLVFLVEQYGWEELGWKIKIDCLNELIRIIPA